MGVKNFWSLHVDEALVASKIKDKLSSDYEVFFPYNSQLKDFDLIIYNVKNHKTKTVQVKSSQGYRSYDSTASGHKVPKKKINYKTVDYFIFTSHLEVPKKNKIKLGIKTHYVIIPTKELLEIVNKTKISPKGICRFSFCIEDKKLWDCWEGYLKPAYKEKWVSYEKYHDNWKQLS